MRKIFLTALTAVLMLSGCSTKTNNEKKDDERYVVILSMDAFRWDLAERADTPTLDSIRKAGVYSETYPCFPANTFPNHYSMATGLYPDHHGIVNNTFYDKTLRKQYSISNREMVQNADFYYGEPIWNTAEKQGLTANIFMWVGSEAPVGGRYATKWTAYDGDIPFRDRADWVIEALNRPKEEIPNLIMWYFEEPDAVEHAYSSTSPQTKAMVEEIDSVIRYMLDGAKNSPVYDKIDFIFTADHGMTTLSPSRSVNLYSLLDNSKINYYTNGSPLSLEPQSDYIDEAYDIISQQEHLQVFKRDEMPEKYHYGSDKNRIMPLLILPDTGWSVSYTPEDYTIVENSGSHGYDPYERDMHMVFYGMGPHFKNGYTNAGAFQNLNMYLIMCHLLDIEPAPNDCTWGDIEGLFDQN